jgi:Domain of unknown function (DUF4169)
VGNIVNLRLIRKRANREQAAQQTAERRSVHGLPKVKRALSTALRDKADRDLDRHRIDEGTGSQ